jgi:small subunit ribosomal protein S6
MEEERLYDLVFICMPATPEEDIAKIIATLEQTATERGARVEKVDRMGTRKLAYRVKKQREGAYIHMALRSSQGDVIKELERRLKVSDPVIKYMTVRLDEEIKRQQKLVGRREHRARRRPRKPTPGSSTQSAAPATQAPPAAPAAPAAPAVEPPATPAS